MEILVRPRLGVWEVGFWLYLPLKSNHNISYSNLIITLNALQVVNSKMLDLSVTLKHYTLMLPSSLYWVAKDGFLVNCHRIFWKVSSIQISSYGPRQTKSTLRLSYSKRQFVVSVCSVFTWGETGPSSLNYWVPELNHLIATNEHTSWNVLIITGMHQEINHPTILHRQWAQLFFAFWVTSFRFVII